VDSITARYRIGNGRAGNIGRESLVHVASPSVLADWPDLIAIRQPIAARGGADPESIEEVRQLAPRAFRAEQFRAVTEKDYERAALKLHSVAAAKCAFRWTGSWHTVFVAVHPRRMEDLITEEGGRTRLTDGMARTVQNHLIRYKLAGYDLEARTAQYVPLEISTELCIAPGHFRGDVLQAAYRALSNRQFADGTVGFFHLSRFTFGQPVYLSQLYAALERVEGVDSAVVTVFKRYWMMANDELEQGVIPMGPWEIPRLDNDPNFMENGILRLTAVGGL
jgi:predicted phage baseplate assembly protein